MDSIALSFSGITKQGIIKYPTPVNNTFLACLELLLTGEFEDDEHASSTMLPPFCPTAPLEDEKIAYRPSRCGTAPYDKEVSASNSIKSATNKESEFLK